MKLLDRHIMREIVPMFFFGVIAFTALIMGGGVFYQMVRFAIDYNVSFFVVFQIFVLKLPEVVAYTMPMSALFCVLLGFNRMSSELEVTAMRTAGISFMRMMVPVLVFGFLVSVLALMLNDRITPMANSRFNVLERGVKSKFMENVKKEEGIVWENREEGKVRSVLYAGKMVGQRFYNLWYIEMKDGIIYQKTLAREAVFKKTYWVFKNGYRINFTREGEPRIIVKFPEMNIIMDQGMEEIAREGTKAGDYTYRELKERIKLLEKEKTDETTLRKLKVDLYSKLSIPFASFAFVFIAAPLGIKPQRASSSVGLGVSVIIIFIYYIVQQLFRALGQGYIDPLLAASLPNTVLCLTGLWLVYKASK